MSIIPILVGFTPTFLTTMSEEGTRRAAVMKYDAMDIAGYGYMLRIKIFNGVACHFQPVGFYSAEVIEHELGMIP